MVVFLCYVLWPLLGAVGLVYWAAMAPGTSWVFLAIWLLAWDAPPLGSARRRQIKALIEEEESGVGEDSDIYRDIPRTVRALFISLAMFFSFLLGLQIAPGILNSLFQVDVILKLQENEERGRFEGHQR